MFEESIPISDKVDIVLFNFPEIEATSKLIQSNWSDEAGFVSILMNHVQKKITV